MAASLTHVCMWTETNWKPITAQEAAKIHPGGTVSARSGLFMCDLCGQYVLLTDGEYKTRHFRHSSSEKDKDCPERTFGSGYSAKYESNEHNLPIRISNVTPKSCEFELGLVRVPAEMIEDSLQIEIKPVGNAATSFLYSKERVNSEKMTYLSIGNRPFENYNLIIRNGNKKLQELWPSRIKGINQGGTIFEKGTGRMLLKDADVEIKKEYYLLKHGILRNNSSESGIKIQKISTLQFGWETWVLYSILAPGFNEFAAKFFLDFHCRLTDQPISLQPVWPVYTEGDYIVRHNQDHIILLVQGRASSIKTFPKSTVRSLSITPRIDDVLCAGRQQLISAGRTKALEYSYFWREPIGKETCVPKIMVNDLNGDDITPGDISAPPKEEKIMVASPYDGEVIVSRNDYIIDKWRIQANNVQEIEGITWGLDVRITIGLDCIWEISIAKKRCNDTTQTEDGLLKCLRIGYQNPIPAPHSLKNMALSLTNYPKVVAWIDGCIKDGKIDEQSYRRLQRVYCVIKSKHSSGGK